MTPLKASGIDGFPALFYQCYWHIEGSKVVDFCLAVLSWEITVEGINTIHIVLIPKVSKPKFVTQLRLISLCNALYKIIAKAIVNRLSGLLDACISEGQCALFLISKFQTTLLLL